MFYLISLEWMMLWNRKSRAFLLHEKQTQKKEEEQPFLWPWAGQRTFVLHRKSEERRATTINIDVILQKLHQHRVEVSQWQKALTSIENTILYKLWQNPLSVEEWIREKIHFIEKVKESTLDDENILIEWVNANLMPCKMTGGLLVSLSWLSIPRMILLLSISPALQQQHIAQKMANNCCAATATAMAREVQEWRNVAWNWRLGNGWGDSRPSTLADRWCSPV